MFGITTGLEFTGDISALHSFTRPSERSRAQRFASSGGECYSSLILIIMLNIICAQTSNKATRIFRCCQVKIPKQPSSPRIRCQRPRRTSRLSLSVAYSVSYFPFIDALPLDDLIHLCIHMPYAFPYHMLQYDMFPCIALKNQTNHDIR